VQISVEDPSAVAEGSNRLSGARAWLRHHNVALPEETGWVSKPTGTARQLTVDLAIVTLVMTIAIVVILQLWHAEFRVPFGYGGDGLQYSRDAKTIVETGWVQATDRLGAPFDQQLYDFAISGDNGNFAIMKILAALTSDWALVLNLFFLLTFFTASWSSYLCLRWLCCGRTSSVVTSILFGLAPYHFGRGAGHLLLSSYFVVPVAVVVAVRAAAGVPLIARRNDAPHFVGRPSAALFHARATLPWVVLLLACASFGSYYAFFTVITIALCSLVIATTRRSIKPLLCAVSYVTVVAGMFGFNILPNLLFRAEHGVNAFVAQRQPIELDLYGLRVIQMLTPVPGHWLGPLRSASETLTEGYPSESSQFFGLVGAAALLMIFGWLAVRVVRRQRADQAENDVRPLLACLTVAWILIATTGGLEWFATLFGFTQLRAWNRVSILILFVCLAWLARTVGPLVRCWVAASVIRSRMASGLAVAVLLFGIADQGSASFVPKTNLYSGTFASDKAFFGSIENQLPTGSMVYQLPYRRFPEEAPLFGSGDYDLYRPYLHTSTIRWSYGGMKGREADWQARLQNVSTPEFTRDILAIGYSGLVIDRAGYSDYGLQIEQELFAVTGRGAAQSSDGRWSFFDLTELAPEFGSKHELADVADHLLNAPRLNAKGCSGSEGSGLDQFHWCGQSGSIHIFDPDPNGSPTVFVASVSSPASTGTLKLTVGGSSTDYSIGPEPSSVEVTVPSGQDVIIGFATDVVAVSAPGDGRDLRFRLIYPQVQPTS